MGVESEITSPTFSIVNEYHSSQYGPVYHLDLYRLQRLEEVSEIGLYEIEESGYFCLIEWASAAGFRPAGSYLEIQLEHLQHTQRRITVRIHEN